MPSPPRFITRLYRRRATRLQTVQLRWLVRHRRLTEDPAASNLDSRADGIRAAQLRLGPWLVGLSWCGVWVANALLAAGVAGVSWRLASVANIEDDARAGVRPFRCWVEPADARAFDRAHAGAGGLRGAAAVLFGRGVHVATVRRIYWRLGLVITDEGNTSSPHDSTGSQSNGGGSYRRVRRLSDVHGFAVVDYTPAS